MHGERGLVPALLATAPRAWRAFTEQRYTGNAICPTRRTSFFPPFLFLLSPPPLFILHEGVSRRRPHLLRSPTCENFICLAYAVISTLVYCIFLLPSVLLPPPSVPASTTPCDLVALVERNALHRANAIPNTCLLDISHILMPLSTNPISSGLYLRSLYLPRLRLRSNVDMQKS